MKIIVPPVELLWYSGAMEKKNNSQTGASPVTPVAVVLPTAFESHDPSLKGAGLQLAIQVGTRHPEIVQSVVELKASIAQAGEKYYHVLHALRAAQLPKKEATALLLGLGFSKSRASELNKLSSVKDEVWAKYSEKSIGFKAALALENGGSSAVGTSHSGNEGDAPTPRKKNKIHSLPKPVSAAIMEAVTPWLAKDSTLPKPMKSGKRSEYGFTVEQNGLTLYFQIFADAAE